MRFTKHMAECCRELSSSENEYSTDKLIEPLIRLQDLMCRVSDAFGYYDTDEASVHGDGAIQHTAGCFLRELTSIRDAFPCTAGSGRVDPSHASYVNDQS